MSFSVKGTEQLSIIFQYIYIQGMTCSSCVSKVEQAVATLPGVASVSVNLLAQKMSIQQVQPGLSPQEIITVVSRVGFTAQYEEVANGIITVTFKGYSY